MLLFLLRFFWLGKSLGHVTIASWLPPCPTVGVSLAVMLLGDVGTVNIDMSAEVGMVFGSEQKGD